MKSLGYRAAAAVAALFLVGVGTARAADPPGRWSQDRAAAWKRDRPWLVGCNFIPSSAINQLEMWQADTFNPVIIDRELGWAESLGYNSVRVFLHDLVWEQDSQAFLTRIDRFLEIADRHHIGAIVVFFDSVWDPRPRPGTQPRPRPGLHNSGWVQSPGAAVLADTGRHDSLKGYVAGVIDRFKRDRRIHAWDLMNEPDNTNSSSYGRLEPQDKARRALELLEKTFAWARAVAPSQPLTAGVWIGDLTRPDQLSPANRLMLDSSDVISFHSYRPLEELKKDVEALQRYGRPLLCTEYMARPAGSTFEAILPYLKEQGIGAYNWGFVAGKSQTIYPWDSWKKPYSAEPKVWFHDIFRGDGTPYDPHEIDFIKRTTAGRPAPATP